MHPNATPCPVHVFMFQPRFVPLIRTHVKRTTIRGFRVRTVHPGDVLDLRTWSGTAYRSRQTPIFLAPCTNVDPIELEIRHGRLFITTRGHTLMTKEAIAFAAEDGFFGVDDMAEWFILHHKLDRRPFRGVVYRWRPHP